MNTENLTIGKKDYTVQIVELNQADLKFYPENPRVYSVLNINGEEPSQDDIEDYMCSMEHVKQLRISIESNGGLIDPLIVRDGDFTVLEGNSRLAAYRLLCRTDVVTWGKVKCKLLPADIDDSAIFALLGQYHIIGRKDWEPFEQASYLYRRHEQTKLPIAYMAQELGITKGKAEKMISVIKFMIENNDLSKKNWSHYEEYLNHPGIKKFRETLPSLDETIVEAVKTGQINAAADMRKLDKIAKIGDKQSKKVIQRISTGEIDIYEGYLEMENTGKFDDVVTKLKAFRQYINDDSIPKQMKVSEDCYKQAQYEIKKILVRLEQLRVGRMS